MVHLDKDGRKTPVRAASGTGYRPNLRFHVDGFDDVLFGLTQMYAEWPFEPGERKEARFDMYALAELIGLPTAGVRFTLQEGKRVVGSGIIIEVLCSEADE